LFLDDRFSRLKLLLVISLHSNQRPDIILLLQLDRVLKECFEVSLLDLLLFVDDPLRLFDFLIECLVVDLPLELAHLVRDLIELPLSLLVDIHSLLEEHVHHGVVIHQMLLQRVVVLLFPFQQNHQVLLHSLFHELAHVVWLWLWRVGLEGDSLSGCSSLHWLHHLWSVKAHVGSKAYTSSVFHGYFLLIFVFN